MGRNVIWCSSKLLLVPLLFSIFVCDFSDYNTIYIFKNDIKGAIESLEHVSICGITSLVSDNQIKTTPNRYHVITNKSKNIAVNVENNSIKNSI